MKVFICRSECFPFEMELPYSGEPSNKLVEIPDDLWLRWCRVDAEYGEIQDEIGDYYKEPELFWTTVLPPVTFQVCNSQENKK